MNLEFWKFESVPLIYIFRCKCKATLATYDGLRHFWAISLWLTPYYACMNFDSSNYILVRGYSLPNLVAIRHFKVDSRRPLHGPRPQKCVAVWSGVLPIKFGGHRTFAINLTRGWLWLTPAWHFPSNELRFDQGFFYKIMLPQRNNWAIWPLVDPSYPLHDLWLRNALHLNQRFFLPKLVAI